MHILYVVADTANEWNSSEWRCAIPARAINATEHRAQLIGMDDFLHSWEEGHPAMDVVAKADCIIYQRNLAKPEQWRACQYWQGTGRAVVLDLDDDYLNLPGGNPAHGYWYGEERYIDNLKQYAKKVDCLTSPSKLILQDWRKEGVQNTLWLPNYAQGKWYENLHKDEHDGFWVGWGGSHAHYDTWFRSGCAAGLKLACEARPDIKVVICGTDRRILDMIPVPDAQKVYGGFVKPSEVYKWPQALAQFDVCIAPLGGQFDHRKSWIKALEAMLAKVPFIGTDAAPYAELGKFGRVVDDSPEQWAEAIIDAHDNYPAWQERAQEAYKQAAGLTMEAQAPRYVGELEKIVQRRRVCLGGRLPGVTRV